MLGKTLGRLGPAWMLWLDYHTCGMCHVAGEQACRRTKRISPHLLTVPPPLSSWSPRYVRTMTTMNDSLLTGHTQQQQRNTRISRAIGAKESYYSGSSTSSSRQHGAGCDYDDCAEKQRPRHHEGLRGPPGRVLGVQVAQRGT